MNLKKKSPFQQTAVKYRFFIYFSFQVFSFRSFYRFQHFRNTFRKPIQVFKLVSTSYSQSNSSYAFRLNQFCVIFFTIQFKLRFSAQHFSQSNSSKFFRFNLFSQSKSTHFFQFKYFIKISKKKEKRREVFKQNRCENIQILFSILDSTKLVFNVLGLCVRAGNRSTKVDIITKV